MNAYQLVSEILMGRDQPNVDMLIVKPMLYTYISKDSVDKVKQEGIKADENKNIFCYFSRVPENIESYQKFLSDHACIKIQISKLEKVKDQKLRIIPYNIPNYTKDLTKDDIDELVKKNNFFFNYFKQGTNLTEIPHAIIWIETGILPSFTYKILE